jgi:uncharacterized protein (DUF58 family)
MPTLTNRFFQLFFLGLVPLAFSGLSVYFLWIALFYDVALFLLACIDWAKTPSPQKTFTFRRETAEKLSLGAENPVTIWVENFSHIPLILTLKDEFPQDFGVDREALALTVSPRSEGAVVYKVLPPRRGDFAFGRLHFRYAGPLGLVQRQGRADLTQKVKVYPNLQEVGKYELLARRGRLEEVGFRRLRLKGEGRELESLRDYVPGDDFRRIHWKATARRGKPIAMEYEAEKNQRVFFLLDCGRMMTAQTTAQGAGPMTKLDYAVNACLMMSYLAVRFQDQAGILAFGREILTYLPPHKGKHQVKRILESLYALSPQLAEPNYTLAFRYLSMLEKKRSLVVIFTDLVDATASRELLRQVKALSPRHLPLFIAIGDPEITDWREKPLQEEEDLYRKAVAAELLESREEALRELTSRGALVLDVPPRELTLKSVNKYLEIKGRGLL